MLQQAFKNSQEKTTFSYSHLLNVLTKEFPSLEKDITSFKTKINNSSETDPYIIKSIQSFLINLFIKTEYTYLIARLCKPIFPLLISQLNEQILNKQFKEEYEALNALSKILPLYPQFKTFIKQYFKNKSSLIENVIHSKQEEQLLQVLQIILRLLIFSPSDFSKLFNWSPLFELLNYNSNKQIKSNAAKCIAILLKLDDQFFHQKVENLDEYILEEIENEEKMHLENTLSFYDDTETAHEENVTSDIREKLIISHKSETMVNVCGVWLHKNLKANTSSESSALSVDPLKSKLIFTATAFDNMRSLALAVSQEKPVLLEGIIGSGKTAYVEELARITGNTDLIKVNLDESFDSKDLLGTYICTDVPGEFKWQPGALTKAVMEGRWILIEDLDLAPFDIVSSILPLVESGNLFLPSRDEIIPAANGFQLFATQSLMESISGMTSRQRVLPMANLWTKVTVKKLPSNEIEHILSIKFESIGSLIPKFIETYDALRGVKIDAKEDNQIHDEKKLKDLAQLKSFGRLFSFRDLLKWCERVKRLYGHKLEKNKNYVLTQIKRDIFHEAIDVFCGMIAKKDVYDAVVYRLAVVWEIYNYEEYLALYKPQIQEENGSVIVGRVPLPREEKNLNEVLQKGTNSTFAHTKQSLKLMEKIAACIKMNEPVLLTGETGTGKTTIIGYLANLMGRKLAVHNLNQQTDSADFIGGFKPVDLKILAASIKSNFEQLFSVTFPSKQNETVLTKVREHYSKKNWASFVMMLNKVIESAEQKLGKLLTDEEQKDEEQVGQKRKKKQKETPKKQKTGNMDALKQYWQKFKESVTKFNHQQILVQNSFAFSFVEGSLVKALREGHWILLDEINLASTETLERLSSLLEGEEGTLYITEKGDTEPVKRHPNFRIFACMNPPTDIGKKNLPPALRNRFSEFYMQELLDKEDLKIVVSRYLNKIPHPPIDDVVNFYLQVKKMSEAELSDGAGQRPHYSLRTLSRSLEYTTMVLSDYGIERSLYEGFCMGFLTLLSTSSYSTVEKMIKQSFLKNKGVENTLNQAPAKPSSGEYVQFRHFWLKQGPFPPEQPSDFIITESVEEHLKNLARGLKSGKYPVLLQGPTSSGKTSLVQYLAKVTGHRFVRINNHESTDLQEYFGTYITNSQGKLVFQEGILVEAVRNGYWLVLDELNLAPSDILEALNRLLDDNRELFIPETQETIKPHPHFQLFATQNPPGLYGGRKVLSRAFRNRFLELHIDEIPRGELITILHRRCQISNQHATKLVNVMRELQQRRQSSKIFAGKSTITPRDLFRWAERMHGAPENVNYNLHAAEEGYMLFAERLRRDDEKEIVKEILEKVFKVKIDLEKLYNSADFQSIKVAGSEIVWTKTMKRMYTLVGKCIQYKEPVLLVGDTGTGKTTICQIYADIYQRQLRILNCHQHTETSDILGSLRPVRGREKLKSQIEQLIQEFISVAKEDYGLEVDLSNETTIQKQVKALESFCKKLVKERKQMEPQKKKVKGDFKEKVLLERQLKIRELYQQWKALFIWYDGPLVEAMKNGDFFLIDEISLAEDAVLERLNSVLEPSRQLTLPERGSEQIEHTTADDNFRILATMNPGGDFGKRELSPALRNRFTEVYVPSLSVSEDLAIIVANRLSNEIKHFNEKMVAFVQYFRSKRTKRLLSVRDVISWVEFMNMAMTKLEIDPIDAYLHGVETVILESIGVGTDASSKMRATIRNDCLTFLLKQFETEISKEKYQELENVFLNESYVAPRSTHKKDANEFFGYNPFYVKCGTSSDRKIVYALDAPTTGKNVMKVLRAMQLKKPLLLEGSPGVGKTSLISAIAKASGHNIVRINLSEQTDMMDLLGSDLPVEGSSGGQFRWSDGIFLRALRNGDWVLLDELNLASQSVLEGLNSVLDHRAEIYIPEINETIKCPEGFRLFACQNPLQQGGGRKGLPKSFLNRFTQVYVDELKSDDLLFIAKAIHGDIGEENLKMMIDFNRKMHKETMEEYKFGRKGSPWEFNLRDVFRWCEMLKKEQNMLSVKSDNYDPMRFIDCIYRQRMRTDEDRKHVERVWKEVSGRDFTFNPQPTYTLTANTVQIGSSILFKNNSFDDVDRDNHALSNTSRNLTLLQSYLNPLENIMKCIEMNYLTIITGPSACGKTSIVRLISQLTGNMLSEFSMSSSTDTVELLGGFEQVDPIQKVRAVASFIKLKIDELARVVFLTENQNKYSVLKHLYNQFDTYELNCKQKSDYTGIEQLQIICDELFKHLDNQDEEYQRVTKQLSNLTKVIEMGVKGRFEWNDGILIRSLEAGNWILIDNVNFCNPTVLDRLNSLLEPDGVLVVNERGLVDGEIRIVKPHPHFRIFMVMDPKYGEISRAMRNRGIEISMFPIQIPSQDAFTLLASAGIPSSTICRTLMDYHSKFVTDIFLPEEDRPSIRDLLRCAEVFNTEVKQGLNIENSFKAAINSIYIRGRCNTDSSRNSAEKILMEIIPSLMSSETLFPCTYVLSNAFLLDKSLFRVVFRQAARLYGLMREYLTIKLSENLDTSVSIASLMKKLTWKALVADLPPVYLQTHDLDQTILKNSEMETTRTLEELVSDMQYALEYFIDLSSLKDIDIRRNWLSRLLILCKDEEVLSQLLEKGIELLKRRKSTPFSIKVEKAFEKLVSVVNPKFSDALLFQPINLKVSEDMYSKLNYLGLIDKETDSIFEKASLLTTHQSRLFDEEDSIKKNYRGSIIEKKTSLLHQSYYYYLNPKHRGSAPNKVVVHLFSLFKQIESFMESFMNASLESTFVQSLEELRGILRCRDKLWHYLNTTNELTEEFFIYWNWLAKDFLKMNIKKSKKKDEQSPQVQYEQLCTLMSEIDNMVVEAFNSTGKKNTLYKYCGKPNISQNMELKQIIDSLENFVSSNTIEPTNRELNDLLLNGMTTAKYITQNPNNPENPTLLESLREVPQLVENKPATESQDTSTPYNELSKPQQEFVIDKLFNDIAEFTAPDKKRVNVSELHSIRALYPLFDHKKISCLCKRIDATEIEQAKGTLSTAVTRCRHLVDFVLRNCSRSPFDLVPYQMLLWDLSLDINTAESGKLLEILQSIPPILNYVWVYWNERVWENTYNQSAFEKEKQTEELSRDDLSGPIRIFQDVNSVHILKLLSGWENIPIRSRYLKMEQIKKIIQLITSNIELLDNNGNDWKNLTNLYCDTLLSFKKTFDEENNSKLVKLVDQILNNYTETSLLNDISHIILQSSDTRLKAKKNELVDICKLIVAKCLDDSNKDLVNRGLAWIKLGEVRMSLFIPANALDPTLKYSIYDKHLKEDLSVLTEKLNVLSSIQKFITGREKNFITENVEDEVEHIQSALDKVSKKVVHRPFNEAFLEIYRDMKKVEDQKEVLHSLVNNFLKYEKRTEEGEQNIISELITKEDSFQSNTLSIIKGKLMKNSFGFEDLIIPFTGCIYNVKYGLRLLCYGCLSPKDKTESNTINQVLNNMLSFPSSNSLTKIQNDLEVVKKWVKPIEENTLNVASKCKQYEVIIKVLRVLMSRALLLIVSESPSTEKTKQNLLVLDEVFALYSNLFERVEEELEKKKEEEDSFYKNKERKIVIQTDEEILEEEMENMFPTYAEDYTQFSKKEEDNVILNVSGKKGELVSEKKLLEDVNRLIHDVSEIDYLVNTHKNVFTNLVARDNSAQTSSTISEIRSKMFDESLGVAVGIINSLEGKYRIDMSSSGHLPLVLFGSRTLNNLLVKVDNSKEAKKKAYLEIYNDPNIPEITLAFSTLFPMLQRLNFLIQKYSSEEQKGHPILVEMVKICEHILNQPVTSPLIKILTGLELLLNKAKEWEEYLTASVHTLQDEIRKLSSLVIRWRRMELENWRGIYDLKAKEYKVKTITWWFRFYSLVCNSDFDSSEIDQTMKDFFEICDDFIRTSSIGDFEFRLDLLHNFCQHLTAQIEKLSNASPVQLKFRDLLYNLYRYYKQFIPTLNDKLEREKKPLEEKLRDFITLTKWEDVNVDSIRATTRKSRKALAQFSKGFANVLAQQARALWDKFDELSAATETVQQKDKRKRNQRKRKNKKNKKAKEEEPVEETLVHDHLIKSKKVISNVMETDKNVTFYKQNAKLEKTIVEQFTTEEMKGNVIERLPVVFELCGKNFEQHILNSEIIKEYDAVVNNLEDLSTEIIERTEELNKKKASKPIKLRALVSLLTELSDLGISYLKKGVAKETTPYQVLQKPFSNVNLKSLNNKEIVEVWNKADDYFFKNVFALQNLRVVFDTEISEDITTQKNKMRGYPDNLFFLTMKHRDYISSIERQQKNNRAFIEIFSNLYNSLTTNTTLLLPSQSIAKESIENQSALLFKLGELVSQLTSLYHTLVKNEEEKTYVSLHKSLEEAKTLVSKCVENIESILRKSVGLETSTLTLITYQDMEKVKENYENLSKVKVILEQFSKSTLTPKCKELDIILVELEDERASFNNTQFAPQTSHHINNTFISSYSEKYVHAVKCVQLLIQDLIKAHSEEKELLKDVVNKAKEELSSSKKDEEEAEDYPLSYLCRNNSVARMEEHFSKCFNGMNSNINKLNDDLISMTNEIIEHTQQSDVNPIVVNSFVEFLANLTPLLQRLNGIIDLVKIPLVHYHKSVCKLDYVLLHVFTTLFKNGFCEEKEGENDENQEGPTEFSSGTGMDDGEGINDVSDQIEQEDQLLNEKDREKNDKETEKNDNAIEMEGDFESELQEMEKDEEEENEEEEDENENKEMGDIEEEDPNKEDLDDKLWDENENDRDDKKEESDEKSNKPQEQDSELKAQENEEDPLSNQNNKDNKKKEPMEFEDEEEPVEEQEEFTDQMNPEETENGEEKDDQNDKDEDNKEEDFNLDNLEIEEDNMEEENDEEEGEDEKEGENETENQNEDEEEATDPLKKKKDEQIDEQVETEDVKQDEEQPPEVEDQEDVNHIDPKLEEENNKEGEDEENKDEEKEGENEEEEEKNKTFAQEEADNTELKETPFGVKQTAGKPSEVKDEETTESERQEKKNNNSEENGQDTNKNELGESMDQGENEQHKDEANQMQMDPNPKNSLGDAMKKWKEKINVVEKNKKEKKEEPKEKQEKEGDAYELVDEDDEDKDMNDQQTLANATEEQSKEFPQMMDDDEEEVEDENQEQKKKEEEKFGNEEKDNEEGNQESDSRPKNVSSKLDKKIELPEDEDENMEDLKFEQQEKKGEFVKTNFESTIHTRQDFDEDAMEEEPEQPKPLTMEEIKAMREELEKTLADWRNSEENVQKSKEVWKQFDILTSSLSQELCEQLRLILEPTLATKLKGDYKTGKRINMKKVIPYIASQFRKDKIWLRRTKPNKRQYQILLAIDDSKSMNDNYAGQMACEALTLIAKAMSQLEVGQLGVVSFGEKMKLLHPFEKPFSDDAGSEILSQFTFNQNQTQMVTFLKDTIQLMENYKNYEVSSQNEQYQLAFVISDGRMLERERIVKLVREGQEKKILFVFILIDNPNPKESILEVKTINSNPLDSKQPLTFSYYIEKFPFPYYIILRDIQTLPEILSDALRQYFELINMTNEQMY
ncbi:hypothetical protein ABK040_000025 [Willaertia magna]